MRYLPVLVFATTFCLFLAIGVRDLRQRRRIVAEMDQANRELEEEARRQAAAQYLDNALREEERPAQTEAEGSRHKGKKEEALRETEREKKDLLDKEIQLQLQLKSAKEKPLPTVPPPSPSAGPLSAEPYRLDMQIVLTCIVGLASLYVILAARYGPKDKHWAYATVGTLIGFWLRG